MSHRLFLPFLVVVLISGLYGTAVAAETLVIKPGVDSYKLGQYLDILEDENGKLTIEDVVSSQLANKFIPSGMATPNFGFTSSAFWFRVRIENHQTTMQNMILEFSYTMLDLIEVYIPNSNGGYDIQRAGDTLAANKNALEHVHFLFDVAMPPDESLIIYLRLESRESLIAPLILWTLEGFAKYNNKLWLFFGIYFGGLLVMLFYNFFIYLSLKDKSYLVYVIYIFSWILVGLTYNGFSSAFLWTSSPWWANRAIIVIAMNVQLWGIVFTRSFLDTKNTVPKLDKYLLAYIWFSGIFMLIALIWPNYTHLMYILVPTAQVYPPLVFAAGLICWRKNIHEAKYFLVAWVFIIIGIIIYGLVHLSIVPHSFITFHAMDIGVVIEATLLSLALASRINAMQKEKELAQQKELEQRQLLHNTLEQAKNELELKVEERTKELKVTNEHLLKAKETAEGATKLKDKFVTLVSHDLRSPVGSIQNMLEMVKNSEAYDLDNDKREDLISKSASTAKRLINLIDQLLNISRLKTGKITPIRKFVSARKVVHPAIANISHLADRKGVTIVNDLPMTLRLFTDATLFGEVIQNLLSNSIKFTNEGDVITLYAPEEKEYTTIAIKDNGTGINELLLPDLFKHEVKTSSKGTLGETGTGLGLPYSFDIVAAHDGDLTVESKEGEGSVFYARLPKVETVILIVDDQEAHRNMMKELIARIIDAQILEADNGKEALTILKDTTPHLIITDIQMPEMNGFELLEALKSSPILDTIPVIISTSYASSSNSGEIDVRQKALSLGADDFIIKPVSASEFIPRVQRFLQ